MKKNKWVSLLCLLLGASTVLGACGGTSSSSSSSSSSESSTDEAVQVEAKFTNFIQTEYKEEWKDMSANVTTLNDNFGTLVGSCKHLYLFKKESVSFLNEIVETWTLFNAKENKTVWTKEHKYENGDYDGTDKYGNEKHAPVEVSVVMRKAKEYSGAYEGLFGYVEVVTKTYEKLPKDTLEQWEEDGVNFWESYKITTLTEWFSADGKAIASTKYQDPYMSDVVDSVRASNKTTYRLSFMETAAEFDKDGKLLSTWNSETEIKKTYFSETEKYGYTYSMYGGAMVMEVYNKADGTLVYNKSFDMAMMQSSGMRAVVALENGDIFIQQEETTYAAEYDYISGNDKVKLVTTRIDVETGKEKDVAFGYVIEKAIDKAEWEELHPELHFTDNVYNVARAQKIENGNLGETVLLFFDNAMNVQYEWKALIPEQIDWQNIDVLASGDLLVQLQTPVVGADNKIIDRAIVTKNGTLVRYVTQDSLVFKEYIVPGYTRSKSNYDVYSFDGEKVGTIDLSSWDRWIAKGRVGDCYLFAVEEDYWGYDEYDNYVVTDTEKRLFIVKEYANGGGITHYTRDYAELDRLNENYLIEYKDGQYHLYDVDHVTSESYSYSPILVTRTPMTVVEYDNCFVVETTYEGESIVYVIDLETRNVNNNNGYDDPYKDYENSGYKGGDEK